MIEITGTIKRTGCFSPGGRQPASARRFQGTVGYNSAVLFSFHWFHKGGAVVRINWRIVFGLVISVAALALVLKNVNLSEVASALATANYWWIIPTTAILLVTMWTRGMRWRALLDDRISPSRSFWIANAGNLLNNVLPFRIGELGRAYMASRNSTVTTMQSLSTVFIERLLDVLSVFGMLVVVFPFVSTEGWLVKAGTSAAAAAFVGVAGLFVAAALRPQVMRLARAMLGWMRPGWREALLHRADDFLQGVSAAGGRPLLSAMLWSVLVWAGWGLASWTFLLAFVPGAKLYMGLFVTCAMALSLSIPSAPSGAGLYEAAAVAGLAVFTVAPDVALAYALLLHVLSFVLIGVLGTIGLDREGESFKHITASAQSMLASARGK